MGNVSAACRLDDNKCTVVSLEIEREDWRIGGSIRDSWRSTGASSSLNGRVSSTLCVSDFYATAAFSLSCLHIRGSRARVDRTRIPQFLFDGRIVRFEIRVEIRVNWGAIQRGPIRTFFDRRELAC